MATILIDGDDTLWHNNRYFLAAIERVWRLCPEAEADVNAAAVLLMTIQRERCPVIGYGPAALADNLYVCLQKITAGRVDDDNRTKSLIFGICGELADHPVRLLDGVKEALDVLARDHSLVLVSKGQLEEQISKLDRSGLTRLFDKTVVVKEKDAVQYRALVGELFLNPSRDWMVGNSPRSDVNPALEAGLGVIYIPHPDTPDFELEPIQVLNGSSRFHEVKSLVEVPKILEAEGMRNGNHTRR